MSNSHAFTFAVLLLALQFTSGCAHPASQTALRAGGKVAQLACVLPLSGLLGGTCMTFADEMARNGRGAVKKGACNTADP